MSNIKLLEQLEALKNEEWTIYRQEMFTLRARDEETRKLYDALYDNVYSKENQFKKYENIFPKKKLSEISYNTNDVFITHTKAIEDYLYKVWHLTTGYDYPVIPKGSIARKVPENLRKYPILSQIQAESKKKKIRGYLQIGNVATPTRYQGSEVTDKQTLYYLIEDKSVITNREFYTVFTRCWKKSSVVLVYVELPKDDELNFFCSKPVKREKYLSLKSKDGQKEMFEKFLCQTQHFEIETDESGRRVINKTALNSFIAKHTEGAYKKDAIILNGELITAKYEAGEKRKPLCRSLIEKESYFNISYMGQVYRILEKNGLDRIKYPFFKNSGLKDANAYSLDIFSAYPTALSCEKLPIDGKVYEEESEDRLNFYRYIGNQLTPDCLICGKLADIVKSDDKVFLFSTDYVEGSEMGRYILEKAHKSKEDKDDIKHRADYGFLQKKFLQLSDNEEFYVLTETYTRELIMVAVISAILNVILNLRSIETGYIQVDALHFNSPEKIDILKKMMYSQFNEYDFRITEKKTGEVLYQSYRELKTKKENRAIARRKQRKAAKK